jgi:hypothetical protein
LWRDFNSVRVEPVAHLEESGSPMLTAADLSKRIEQARATLESLRRYL